MAERQAAMTEAVYYILLSLREPNHGYGIIQNTLKLTGGRLELGAGTLYGALNTLLEKQWIRLYSEDISSRKKKQYILTETGLWSLQQEVWRLEELVENGRWALGTEGVKTQDGRLLPAGNGL
ncbi:PadR family transcriptional regulator [Lachnospiraceae bacterium 29-84]